MAGKRSASRRSGAYPVRSRRARLYSRVSPRRHFFSTVALIERRRRWLTEHIGELRAAFTAVRSRKPFTANAIVVLPDPLHCLWTQAAGDADFSSRWHAIKARFGRAIPAREQLSPRRQRA